MTLEKASFAGGCFWCMEHPFDQIEGVERVIPGYTGGFTENPTYQEVCSGSSGHLEAVQVTYNPEIVSYESLLDVFWRQIDPTDAGGQFADRGSQYVTAIFYHNEAQKKAAEQSRQKLEKSGKFPRKIATEILAAETFYPAEEYHQQYYKKCPMPYKRYRSGSGRETFLSKVWQDEKKTDKSQSIKAALASFRKPNRDQLKATLTEIQFKVTQKNGTERAFGNEFWDHKAEGLYVDLVSGEPLFSSQDKFDSGTGWPSFTKPLVADNIKQLQDRSLFMTRTEVRSRFGDSHLGHVFNDGPDPTGQRFCINSAALRFIPKERLVEEGYGDFLSLFEP